MSIWILVLYLHTGYGGGVVTIEFPTVEACQEAMKSAKTMYSYEDAHCFNKPTGKGIKP